MTLDDIGSWMRNNRIMLNVQKTVSMLIRSPRKVVGNHNMLSLSVNGVQISCVKETKYLGVFVDH